MASRQDAKVRFGFDGKMIPGAGGSDMWSWLGPARDCDGRGAGDGWLYVSGQIPLDPATGQVVGDDGAGQVAQVLTKPPRHPARRRGRPGGGGQDHPLPRRPGGVPGGQPSRASSSSATARPRPHPRPTPRSASPPCPSGCGWSWMRWPAYGASGSACRAPTALPPSAWRRLDPPVRWRACRCPEIWTGPQVGRRRRTEVRRGARARTRPEDPRSCASDARPWRVPPLPPGCP
jgi:hypothetical protein